MIFKELIDLLVMWYFGETVVTLNIFFAFFLFFLQFRNDGSEFGGSIYQKVNDKLETAVNLAWTAGSNGTRFGIAAKYQLDSSASVSVRCFFNLFQSSYASPSVCQWISHCEDFDW